VDVLRPPQRWVRHRPVRSTELPARNVGDLGPERDRSVEVEALVQIQMHPQARLVDVEEVRNHAHNSATSAASLLAGLTAPSVFAPSPAYSNSPANRNSRSDS